MSILSRLEDVAQEILSVGHVTTDREVASLCKSLISLVDAIRSELNRIQSSAEVDREIVRQMARRIEDLERER